MPLAETNNLFINNYSFDNLVFIVTQYGEIYNRVFHKLALWKRKVETTYLFHQRVALVLTKVQS
jgi:hypothetical protein